jgi:hypothetical protein
MKKASQREWDAWGFGLPNLTSAQWAALFEEEIVTSMRAEDADGAFEIGKHMEHDLLRLANPGVDPWNRKFWDSAENSARAHLAEDPDYYENRKARLEVHAMFFYEDGLHPRTWAENPAEVWVIDLQVLPNKAEYATVLPGEYRTKTEANKWKAVLEDLAMDLGYEIKRDE